MVFHGLFIGVDKYASPLVTDLTCSKRDAQALYGLFADTLGEGSVSLLVDTGATRLEVLRALKELTITNPDDFVFIHFSGHGSDTHHLVTHDADPLSLDTSAIHLQDLVDLFTQIPAKNLLLCLDCCFAGGAGAKVFHAPVAFRDLVSTEELLQRIGGSGRVIFTAAGENQEAIEDRRRGHGVFTFFLLQALKGAPEVLDSGAIPFLTLIQFVTASVQAAAEQFRHVQNPGIRGVIDGEIRLPVLRPASIYQSYFPDAVKVSVTADLNDLGSYGFPPAVIEAFRQGVPSLNDLQQMAINEMGLFDSEHLVVSAPTSSGKTMIGELAAFRAYLRGERSYMLLPLRALVNDKYEDLRKKYSAFGIRVIRSTGEISDDNDSLMRGKFDIALLTYERFTNLSVAAPFVLRNVGLIVIDEVQMITDPTRGANLEFMLTFLRAQRVFGIEPQLIALSAVIGELNRFDRWMGARLLATTDRPVPLEEGTLTPSGDYHFIGIDGKEQRINRYVIPEYRKGSSQDIIIPLVRQLVQAGEKVIVFRETKPIVQATAKYLAESLGLSQATGVISSLPAGDPSAASSRLRECLYGGVAFHNADLQRREREAIEASFRDPSGEVKVLVATTTLAMGVNTPAWSVVIEGLQHPGGNSYTVAEYKNMVGRAGRLGWSPKGKAFLISRGGGDEARLWKSYVCSQPEPLISRFAQQDLLSAVCRVLATAKAIKVPGLNADEVVNFFQSSFAAYLAGHSWSVSQIRSAVFNLEQAGLVEELDGKYRLTPLGMIAGELGIHVESIVRIARGLRGVSPLSICPEIIVAAAQTSLELDEVFMPIHRTSTKERQRWQVIPSQQRLPSSLQVELRRGQDAEVTVRCKKLAAALMWIQGVELGRLEESLLVHMPGNNASGPIRSVAERTRDLVPVVTRVITILNKLSTEPFDILCGLADKLSIQLELGIPQDLVWLASELKGSLHRGEYLSLHRLCLNSPSVIVEKGISALREFINDELLCERIFEFAHSQIEKKNEDDLPMPIPAI